MYKSTIIVAKAVHKNISINQWMWGEKLSPFITKPRWQSIHICNPCFLGFICSLQPLSHAWVHILLHVVSLKFSSEEEPKVLLWSALMRSCFSSADYSEHWFTFVAFWGFHEAPLASMSSRDTQRLGGLDGWHLFPRTGINLNEF